MLIEEAEKIRASIEPTRVVMVNDCTPEALLVHIESNPNGVLVVRDELHGWLTNILDSKNTNERALYTEGFEGNNSYVQKRITRKEVIIPRMHIGVLGCIQPDRVRPVLKGRKNGESNDGFFERFQLGIFSINPIPSGQGRNQPLYECHATKSGRNRVNLIGQF